MKRSTIEYSSSAASGFERRIAVPNAADFEAAKAEGRTVTSAYIAERRSAAKAANRSKTGVPAKTTKPPAKAAAQTTIGQLRAHIAKLKMELLAAQDRLKLVIASK